MSTQNPFAFPQFTTNIHSGNLMQSSAGMTLREWYAAAALPAAVEMLRDNDLPLTADHIGDAAWSIANALVRQEHRG